MGRLSQKEKNRRKGSLLHPEVGDSPIIVQSNNVIRVVKQGTGRKPRKKKTDKPDEQS